MLQLNYNANVIFLDTLLDTFLKDYSSIESEFNDDSIHKIKLDEVLDSQKKSHKIAIKTGYFNNKSMWYYNHKSVMVICYFNV